MSELFNRFKLGRKPPPINYPVSSLFLQRKGNEHCKIGVASMQGIRDYMEDAHMSVMQLPSHKKSVFAVFDGHSGAGASLWCSKNIHNYIDRVQDFSDDDNISNMLFEADSDFLETDVNTHGSTLVMAIIDNLEGETTSKEREVIVVNIGDSRCLIGKKNSEAYCMTIDHKPGLKEEEERIINAGGFVARDRIDGFLSVSRSIGDSGFKLNKDLAPEKQKMIPKADITRERCSNDDFVFLCCDGIFETFTNETVMDFIRNYSRTIDDPAIILSKLLEEALKLGSKDNLSAILIQFKDGSSYEREDEFVPGQWYENGNETFQRAYKEFAEKCGSSLEEAKSKWEEKKGGSSTSSSTPVNNSNSGPPKLQGSKGAKKGMLKVEGLKI